MSEPRLGHPCRLEDGIWWFGYKHARNIPDELFLDALRIAADHRNRSCASRWDIEAVLGGLPLVDGVYDNVPGVPSKVVLAKARRLINRKIIYGCACGCRGDLEIIGEV